MSHRCAPLVAVIRFSIVPLSDETERPSVTRHCEYKAALKNLPFETTFRATRRFIGLRSIRDQPRKVSTSRIETAAGVTPGIRAACPIVRGRTRASF